MNLLYEKIWNEAKPYYEKGRPMDIDHIKWMMRMVDEICKQENLDKTILMPLAILHDVGYSELSDPVNVNYYGKDIRKTHMKAGQIIAENILKKVDYPKEKIYKITWYVSVHDNWSFGDVDMYIKDKILGTFKDLDYLWIYTKEGCLAIQKTLKKNDKEMLEHLLSEKTPIYNKKPFSTEYTRKLREKYMKERISDYKD